MDRSLIDHHGLPPSLYSPSRSSDIAHARVQAIAQGISRSAQEIYASHLLHRYDGHIATPRTVLTPVETLQATSARNVCTRRIPLTNSGFKVTPALLACDTRVRIWLPSWSKVWTGGPQ